MLDSIEVAPTLLELARPFAPGLPASDDEARAILLADAGLTSLGAVRLMLAVEATFALTIPEPDLTPRNFASLAAIEALLARLRSS